MLDYYQALNPQNWQGRTDSLAYERFFQIVQCIDLQHDNINTIPPHSIVLLGFACDTGVIRNAGRAGAAQGPRALRCALSNLTLAQFATPENIIIYDIGDIVCPDDNLEAAQTTLASLITQCLIQQCQPIVLGGGHEIAWGHYQGIAGANQHASLGIINIDAHFDLRPLSQPNYGTSGTPFLQIAHHCQQQQNAFRYLCLGIQPFSNTRSLFTTAQQLNTHYLLAHNLRPELLADNLNYVQQFVDSCDHIYLTLCMDSFAANIAPGVSAPQAAGIYPWQLEPLLDIILRSHKVAHFDVAELAPPLDRDNMTAQLAAYYVAKVLTRYSLHTRKREKPLSP
ncbi:MAG: formimidoylglutamase [Gammaproteobacteria bacterium]